MAELIESSKTSQRNIPINIQHWQLRDLLQPSENPSLLYFSHDACILRFNSLTNISTTILRCDFLPVSFASNSGYTAAGGYAGQVLLTKEDSNSPPVKVKSLDISPINSIQISSSRNNNTPQMFICNNNNSIHIVSLPDLDTVDKLSTPHAPNSCALSNDSRMLLSGGDCGDIILHSSRSDGSFEKVASVTNNILRDAVICCAWDSNGNRFAVGGDDGFVLIYDLRKLSHPLSKIRSSQKGVKGSIRTVKFAKAACVDLLAFSEHVNVVHVIDCRDLSLNDCQSQQISVPNSNACRDVNIAGLCFTSDATQLAFATEASLSFIPIDHARRRAFGYSAINTI
eukprot:CAMPEP_0182443876 /NCGR_PEP_ID=MMETSP1172-20130603/2487_1 /TAXON_ID=708627 /ORGANISM="Timspurckia oligopyrenoides, Strain CCMP3278" /LENGTH=340 /DNA_ID=CAMNT_0024639277 /DNA_START=119 /DNA_END=1141 /DNA_ORIENTATION=-